MAVAKKKPKKKQLPLTPAADDLRIARMIRDPIRHRDMFITRAGGSDDQRFGSTAVRMLQECLLYDYDLRDVRELYDQIVGVLDAYNPHVGLPLPVLRAVLAAAGSDFTFDALLSYAKHKYEESTDVHLGIREQETVKIIEQTSGKEDADRMAALLLLAKQHKKKQRMPVVWVEEENP